MTTQIRLSCPSRFSAFKAIILCLLAGAACISFVGCGGDTESSTSPIGEITSSSSDEVIEGIGKFSSSSNKVEPDSSSSSSVTQSESNGSSSSVAPNESSSSVQSSLSEVAAVSSSSDVVAESSSSEKSSSSEAESSSSVESSSSEVPSSSSVIESSSSVAESSSSEIMISSSSVMESSSSEESSSSQQNVILDSSYYDAEENTLKDFRDGRIYKTITIGTQIWMAENINLEYNRGTAKSFCFNDSTKYCDVYGRLYTKAAAMDSAAVYGENSKGCGGANYGNCVIKKPVRGICPEKWHLPDSLEWLALVSFVGGDKTNLMSSTAWDELCDIGNDVYNFAVLPGGNRGVNGKYANFGANEEYWLPQKNHDAMNFGCYKTDWVFSYLSPKEAHPIRCIKDSE